MNILLLSLSAIALFFNVWIILPAPIFPLLFLSLGIPEFSPILLLLNAAIAFLVLAIWFKNTRFKKTSFKLRVAIALNFISLSLSLLPLIQLPNTIGAAETAFSKAIVEVANQAQMRSHIFSFTDLLRGIPTQPVRLTADIEFASPDQVPLKLDVYRPPQPGIYPAIVVIHGGAWQGGDKADHAQFSNYMAARGYVVWSISYRLAPRYKFPTQMQDVQTALAFIQNHGSEYETDLTRVALMGRSAGAHLAMLAAYRVDAFPVRAVVNYYGPIDLLAGYYDLPVPDPIDSRTMLKAFLGGTPDQYGDRYKMASPINYVNRPLPASLLIYGGKDRIVMAKFGKGMAQRLQESGGKSIFLEIPWADHAFDAIFRGLSNQFALYYTERFLAWSLK